MSNSRRKQAIRRRNRFLVLCVCLLVAIVLLIVIVVNNLTKSKDGGSTDTSAVSSITESKTNTQDVSSSEITSSKADEYNPDNKQPTDVNGVTLDANFRRVLLVNGENPLPDSYDSDVRKYLVEVPKKYRNNDNVYELHKDIMPYVEAMVQKAHDDGVDLRVWSPFRSYATQNILFQRQVDRMKAKGYTGKEAETQAATVVARPGTSEHNTGLCADFNMADDKFESTEMYKWMCENAEDYGFILRYPKSKQDITGVIYESWHWRFVGINTAKEMNKLGLTLEEYVKLKNIDNSVEL